MLTSRCTLALTALGVSGFVNTTSADTLTGTLQKVAEKGEITIGHRDSAIPLSFLDAQQAPNGFSIDICKKIVDGVRTKINRPDLKLVYLPVTSQTRIPLMANETIDLECGSTTNTPERHSQVDFSITTFVAGGRLLVKTNSGIKNLDDLSGKTVAANQGSSPVRALLQIDAERKLNLKMIPAKDFAESFLLLETGRVVAVAQDDVLLAGLRATARNPADYQITGDAFTIEPYAIMLRKDDPSFKKVADDVITSMMASGEFDRLYAQWFQSPFPPRNVNMDLPMSEQLKRVVAKPTDSSDPNSYR